MLLFFSALWYVHDAYVTLQVPDDDKTIALVATFGSFILWAIFLIGSLGSRDVSFTKLQSLKTCVALAVLLVAAIFVPLFGGLLDAANVAMALEIIIAILFLLMIVVMLKQNYDDTRLPSLTVSLSVFETFVFLLLAIILFYVTTKAIHGNRRP